MGFEAPILTAQESGFLFAWITFMLFLAFYLLALATRRSAVMDSAWPLAFGLGITACAVFSPGDPFLRSILVLAACIWSLRRGLSAVLRIGKNWSGPQNGDRTQSARVSLLRWLTVVALGSPLVLALRSDASPGLLQWGGLALVGVAVLVESVADWKDRPGWMQTGLCLAMLGQAIIAIPVLF